MEVINLTGKDADEIKKAINSGSMVYIGRSREKDRFPNVRKKWGWLKDSPWQNKNNRGTRGEKVEAYRQDLLDNPGLLLRLPELKGKTLACWCKPEPCHGDILIEYVKSYKGVLR